MLATRIIPCLDIKDGRVVKGVNFVDLMDAGDPVENAKFYAQSGADELCFLDITASSDKRDIVARLVEKVADEIFIPFTVGGGIRSVDDIYNILHAGADKASLNTAAFENPQVLADGAARFGAQCIVCAIDARRVKPDENINFEFEVYLHGGRTPTGKNAVDWARQAADLGAGEILLTSMDRDGTNIGYDLDLTAAVRNAVPVPVIASGGAGKPEHLAEVIEKTRADAVLAASIFHFRKYTIAETKQIMANKGIVVRPV